MQTYQSAFEETAQCQFVLVLRFPAVIVGIADDKTREHKEEIHSQMPVVKTLYDSAAGKGKSLEYVIPYNHKCCSAAQAIE